MLARLERVGIFAGTDSVHVSCSYVPISFWHQTFLSRKVNLVVYISITVFKAQRNSQAHCPTKIFIPDILRAL